MKTTFTAVFSALFVVSLLFCLNLADTAEAAGGRCWMPPGPQHRTVIRYRYAAVTQVRVATPRVNVAVQRTRKRVPAVAVIVTQKRPVQKQVTQKRVTQKRVTQKRVTQKQVTQKQTVQKVVTQKASPRKRSARRRVFRRRRAR